MRFKDAAITEKETDKARAKASLRDKNKKFAAFFMDLEFVSLAPCLEVRVMYFMTKLAVHTFTVYDLVSGAVTCYVWKETEGGRTASEFAFCIIDYLQKMDRHENVVIFSNGCTYQNRNAVLSEFSRILQIPWYNNSTHVSRAWAYTRKWTKATAFLRELLTQPYLYHMQSPVWTTILCTFIARLLSLSGCLLSFFITIGNLAQTSFMLEDSLDFVLVILVSFLD